MLDIAIIGGGLCGLALADSLQTLGLDFALFEARAFPGGRIRSVRCETTGAMADLGPAWFWPETDRSMAGLVASLGLASFRQHDDGTIVHLKEAAGKVETRELPDLHGGAHRLAGGMAALVQALAERLAAERIKFAHVLGAVYDRGGHVELHFRCGEASHVVRARRAVLAMPPRLIEAGVSFDPPLPESLRLAMRAAPTWMAGAAKAVVAYPRPFWRAAGHSGNAFVTHDQATLAEIFDACDAAGEKAALGGFVALPPALRAAFRDGLPMLIHSQFAQVYGPELGDGELHYQDWALEPHTAAALDSSAPAEADPAFGSPVLSEPRWEGRLWFGGSETAPYGGGRLEGALAAAGRLRRALASAPAAAPEQPAVGRGHNGHRLAAFGDWVAQQRRQAGEHYRRRLQQSLSAQRREQMTQRAVLETAEALYREALMQLAVAAFDMAGLAIERGRSELTPAVLAPFMGFSDAFLDQAVRFNRTSCALSNFPSEHEPAPAYLNAMRRDLAAAWREFALAANELLVSRSEPSMPAAASQ